jgi:hypothetical protein
LGSKFILEAKTDFGLGKAAGPFCTNPFGGIKAMSFQNDKLISPKSMKNAQNHAKQQINF